jgi:hypothetical protein
MQSWLNVDPTIIYWWIGIAVIIALFISYIIISEREYWRGFQAGKRVAQNNYSERSVR